MNRRRFLRRVGLVGATAALAGCPARDTDDEETPERTPTPTDRETPDSPSLVEQYADRFDTVVDVTAAGADPSGEESITPVLEDASSEDTLLHFPEGEYLMAEGWERPKIENFGLVGTGAVIRPPDGFDGYLFGLGKAGQATDLLVHGLQFDVSAERTGARVLDARVDDGLQVTDVAVSGVQYLEYPVTRFDVTSPDGTGVVKRLSLPDGGQPGTLAVGTYVSDMSKGTLEFRDCQIEGFPNNGLYGSSSEGPLHVIGGYYANNDIANVRVGDEGVIDGVHVRCDEAPSRFENMRGIRLRNGTSARVTNCTVELLDVTYSDGAIVIEPWMEGAVIEDTTVRIDADDIPALQAKSTAEDVESGVLACRRTDIDGAAAGNQTVTVTDRDGCVFEDMTVRQTGEQRNGLYLERSVDNELSDSRIDVTGDPVVLKQADIERANTEIERRRAET